MNLGRGSKKRISRIRWKRSEIFYAVGFLLLMAIFCVWLGLWLQHHYFD